MAEVALTGITKFYRERAAVDNLSLTVDAGSFTCQLGPSGCGKTTTLRMIGGFIEPDAGDVLIAGQSQRGRPPQDRPTAMVFQDYALFPHLTVGENVGYGLKVRGLPVALARARVAAVMDRLHLGDLAERFPRQLSGGQQQRVALADQVVIMNEGRLERLGSPLTVYHHPATPFVADFIGQSNFLRGRFDGAGVSVGGYLVQVLRLAGARSGRHGRAPPGAGAEAWTEKACTKMRLNHDGLACVP